MGCDIHLNLAVQHPGGWCLVAPPQEPAAAAPIPGDRDALDHRAALRGRLALQRRDPDFRVRQLALIVYTEPVQTYEIEEYLLARYSYRDLETAAELLGGDGVASLIDAIARDIRTGEQGLEAAEQEIAEVLA